MKLLIYLGVSILIVQNIFPQSYVFQQNLNGYTGVQDVTITALNINQCYGLFLKSSDNQHGLINFTSLGLSYGKYQGKFQISVETIFNPGTLFLYLLKRTDWSDPHANLNPPPSNSTNPTWTHVNFSSKTWQTPGAIGSTDKGILLGQIHINSVNVYIFNFEIEIQNGQTEIAFILLSSGIIEFQNNDSYVSQAHKPKLTLTPLKRNLPTLDQSPIFDPKNPLRFIMPSLTRLFRKG